MNNEQRIRQYLQQKAESVQIAPAASPATSHRPQPGRGRVAALAAAAALVLIGAPLVILSQTAEDAAPTVSTVVESTTTTADSTPPTTSAPVVPVDGFVLDPRSPDEVFALVELDAGGVGVGYSSSHLSSILLPAGPLNAEAVAAVPDGRGGFVYTTTDQVFWLEDWSASARLIEDPGVPVSLVGLRYVAGNPTVFVLIGVKLIGYDQGNNELGYAFDEFSATPIDLDVDGELAVGLVSTDEGFSVELVSMLTGVQTQLIAPVPAGQAGAPLAVAISDQRIAIRRHGLPVQLLAPDGSEIGTVDLGIEDMVIHEMDLAGDSLLVAFGEAATITDIVTGARTVADTPRGWVIGASWTRPVSSAPPTVSATTRFRVDTDMVLADTADPYLNVRESAGADNRLIAKLPPTYTGIDTTGQQVTTADDAVWVEITMLDPIAVDLGEPLHGGVPYGWVNSAYLEPLYEGLPVTTEEVAACSRVTPNAAAADGSRPPSHLYALDSAYLSPNCLRIVLTFGTGPLAYSRYDVAAEVGPASSVPQVMDRIAGSQGATFDLGGIASAWHGATETDDGVYVVHDGAEVDLLVNVAIGDLVVHELPARGIVVIDIVTEPQPEVLPAAGSTVLTQPIWPSNGTLTLSGIARPFEATLGVEVRDEAGNRVDAMYSGSLVFGTKRATEYAVMTPGWSEAWAPFTVRISGLPPGDYTVVLDGDGGADSPVTLDIPFTMEPYAANPTPAELASTDELAIVQALVGYAKGERNRVDVPFADEVVLGLNVVEQRNLARQDLSNRSNWNSDIQDFDGAGGPFNVLDVLARSDFVEITTGEINHCAGPPLEWPAVLDGLRQVNIQPIGGDSCLQWFGVSIFLDATDEIAAVVLDLFGP